MLPVITSHKIGAAVTSPKGKKPKDVLGRICKRLSNLDN